MTKTINTLSVDTPFGVRSFHLHQGDICNSQDQVIVASSHANAEKKLVGGVLQALEERFSYDFTQVEPMIVPRGCFGTYRLSPSTCNGRTVLLVRTPASQNILKSGQEPLAVYKEALWTMFGSLAALEFGGTPVKSISFPVLAGDRDYDIRELLTIILQSTLRWLRWSQTAQEASLYVYSQADFQAWFQNMDDILGRKYFESPKDSILDGLRQELVSLLKNAKHQLPERPWMTLLLESLGEEKLRFHSLAMAGRKLAESMCEFLLTELGAKSTGHLYAKIKTLRDSRQVAPWVINYLSSLKDFGNETAHDGNGPLYRPEAVTSDDLLALLCSLSRLVQIWMEWKS